MVSPGLRQTMLANGSRKQTAFRCSNSCNSHSPLRYTSRLPDHHKRRTNPHHVPGQVPSVANKSVSCRLYLEDMEADVQETECASASCRGCSCSSFAVRAQRLLYAL